MNKPQFSPDPSASRFVTSVVANYTAANQDINDFDVDNQRARPNDRRMTDLTRQEVDAKLAQNKAEVDARLAQFDTSVKTGFADLRAEFAGLRTEIAKMQGGFEKQSHDSTKWIIGSVFAMLSLSVAIIGVMINLNKADKPAAPTPAPMVIYAQPAPNSAPQAPAAPQPPAK